GQAQNHASNTLTRDVTVTATNDPPVGAANYSHAVSGNVRIQVGPTLLGGVTDPEGDTLTAQKDATSAEVGNVTINANGSGSYNGPLTLLNTQKLIGQGASASITTISALTLAPDSDALPATGGTAPTLTNASGNVINLAQNDTLRGIQFGDRSGIAISGTVF